jgi:hypothetical protein
MGKMNCLIKDKKYYEKLPIEDIIRTFLDKDSDLNQDYSIP